MRAILYIHKEEMINIVDISLLLLKNFGGG
jgi:hypothetical protein